MEKQNGDSAATATEVLSPSKITDYFCSKAELSDHLHGEKELCKKEPSIYLTPESSPVKDQQDDSSQGQGISDIKSESNQSPSSTVTAAFSKEIDISEPAATESSPKKMIKSADSSNPHVTRSLNGCVKDETVTDTTKRKSGQHRICRIASVNTDTHSSADASSVESSAVSSPSLPRSKVRKDSKPRSAKPSSQPNATAQSTVAKPKAGRKKKTEPIQSTAITDYFPIRRSGRQTKSQIEKETQLHVEKLIQCNCEDGLEVKDFEGKGRGVVATKVFDKGDFVVEYAGDLLDIAAAQDRELKYSLTPSIGCYMYFFNHRNKQYCVDATQESGRLGRLINHSRGGNCGTKVVMVDGQVRLILVAARHIQKGEELCYDYGDRSKSSLEAHPWLKL